jgi:hypothetical protein
MGYKMDVLRTCITKVPECTAKRLCQCQTSGTFSKDVDKVSVASPVKSGFTRQGKFCGLKACLLSDRIGHGLHNTSSQVPSQACENPAHSHVASDTLKSEGALENEDSISSISKGICFPT